MLRVYFVLCLVVLFSASTHARQSCDWPFRTSVQIQQNDFDGLNDYPVDLVLTSTNMNSLYKWSSAGQDLRVFSGDDLTALPFKINSWSASSKSAEVRVSFPTLNKGTRTIYLYYGNPSVISASQNVPDLPYVNGKIKFHTRSNQGVDPENLTEAKSTFNTGNDTNTAYGCSHPDNFTGVTNRNQGTGRSQNNFIAYSKTRFTVDVAGNWGVRYGADFGYGGGLYIDKVNVLEEIWNPIGDFWWNTSWSNQYVLDGSIYLTAGEHELEVIGVEDCCDGGVTVQFSRNYNGSNYNTATWLPFTADNIDIRSEACPIPSLTVSYGGHDVCYNNLSLLSSSDINQYWTAGSTQTLALTIRNEDTAKTTSSGSTIKFSLPSDLSFSSASGNNWSCSDASDNVTCTYAQSINASAQSTTLNLSLALNTDPANSSYSISPVVSGNNPDNDTSNNSLTLTINVLDSSGIPASCSNPQPGLLARFFDINGYYDNEITNASEFQALVDNRANIDYLMGQTTIPSINKSSSNDGNPFDTTTNDNFLLIIEGYIYLTNKRNNNYFGIDGDDSVEMLVKNAQTIVAASHYGNHPVTSVKFNETKVSLDAGFTPIEFRLRELTGQDAFFLYWSSKKDRNYTIIPSSNYYHCAGNADIQLNSTIQVISDPINSSNFKAIPGAVIQHTVNANNIGNISTDINSTVLVQAIDSQSTMYVGDLSAGSPVIFNDGAGNQASGLSYTFNGLTSNTDSLAFSTDGTNFNYAPVADTDGYDANITHFRLTLGGTFKPTFNGNTPTFNFVYQVKVD